MKHYRGSVILAEGQIQVRARLFIQKRVFACLHDADHLEHWSAGETNFSLQRALAGPQPLSERFVDDGLSRRVLVIMFVENASLQHRYAHDAEVVRLHGVTEDRKGIGAAAGGLLVAEDRSRALLVKRNAGRQAHS